MKRDRRRADRDRQRPLLGDGPRQPLAARREGVPRDRLRRRPEVPHAPRRRSSYYYEHPTEPNMTGDEFVTPSVITGDDGTTPRDRPRRRLGHLLQLPRRPPARADQGVRPRPISPASTAGRKLDALLHDDDRLRAGPARPRRVSQAAEDDEHPRRVRLATSGCKQFRCAETEKFPHVTFFFNDYREQPFPGEDRQIIRRPARRRSADTYDQMPEMSALRRVRRSRQADRLAAVRPDRRQLRQRRHGRPHRRARRRRSRRSSIVDVCVGRILDAIQTPGRRRDRHRRPRQLRADDRPRHRRPAHRPHDLRRRADRRGRPLQGQAHSPRAAAWPTSPRPCCT